MAILIPSFSVMYWNTFIDFDTCDAEASHKQRLENFQVTVRMLQQQGPGFRRSASKVLLLSHKGCATLTLHQCWIHLCKMRTKVLTERTVLGALQDAAAGRNIPGVSVSNSAGQWRASLRTLCADLHSKALAANGAFAVVFLEESGFPLGLSTGDRDKPDHGFAEVLFVLGGHSGINFVDRSLR